MTVNYRIDSSKRHRSRYGQVLRPEHLPAPCPDVYVQASYIHCPDTSDSAIRQSAAVKGDVREAAIGTPINQYRLGLVGKADAAMFPSKLESTKLMSKDAAVRSTAGPLPPTLRTFPATLLQSVCCSLACVGAGHSIRALPDLDSYGRIGDAYILEIDRRCTR